MQLEMRHLIELPVLPTHVCEVADAFVHDWVPELAIPESDVTEQLDRATARIGTPLPTALRWLYTRFGPAGNPLFTQDPVVGLECLARDDFGIITFRTEQQGCVEWGFAAGTGADPEVVIKSHLSRGSASWQPHQSRLSHHVLDGVMSEALLRPESHAAALEPTTPAIEALERLATLGIPPHPFWAAEKPGALVTWYGQPDVVVRSDAGEWLWALGRTEEDLDLLTGSIPGEWRAMDHRPPRRWQS